MTDQPQLTERDIHAGMQDLRNRVATLEQELAQLRAAHNREIGALRAKVAEDAGFMEELRRVFRGLT